MIETAIAQLTNQENLDFTMSQQVITEIMKGQATDAQIGSFLTALAIKKATIDEIAGAATAMRSQALPFKVKRPTLEIVGTGGDRSNSFNISTTTALVVAAAGVPVTKHGNRAASSKKWCGGCFRSTRYQNRSNARSESSIARADQFCLYVCARISSGDAIRRSGPATNQDSNYF